MNRARRLTALDGIRGVAITAVLAAHAINDPSLHWSRALGQASIFTGELGVYAFFGISGFLITTLLINERRTTGTVDLRRFYTRRLLRIGPPLYLYVGALTVLTALGLISVPSHDLLFSSVYLRNYSYTSNSYVGVLWSLCVEEQFYLLWPLAFRSLTGNGATKLLVGLLVGAPLIRGVTYLSLRQFAKLQLNEMDHYLTGVWDLLAVGCLLAILVHRARWLEVVTMIQAHGGLPISSILVVALWLSPGGQGPTHAGPGTVLLPSACAAWIFLVLHRYIVSKARHPTWLSLGPLVWWGMASYSLYLWHILFIPSSAIALPPGIGLLAGIAVSLGAYFTVEIPTERVRRRLRPGAVVTRS